MFRPDDIDAFNDDVKSWTDEVKLEAVDRLYELGVVHRKGSPSKKALTSSVSTRQRQRNGITYRTSFVIPRHSVFLHKGVGKETPIELAGKTNRKAKKWLNPPIEDNFPKLENIVADHQGQMVLNAIIIK